MEKERVQFSERRSTIGTENCVGIFQSAVPHFHCIVIEHKGGLKTEYKDEKKAMEVATNFWYKAFAD